MFQKENKTRVITVSLLLLIILAFSGFACEDDSTGITAGSECSSANPEDYVGIEGAQVLMSQDFNTMSSFFYFPFPNDYRMDDDGTINLEEYPGGNKIIANKIVEVADEKTYGFGLYSAIYMTFSGLLDETTLPQTVAETAVEGSSVFLINLETGDRAPISVKYWPNESEYNPPNMISASPFYGTSLEPASTYALIVTRDVLDANGSPVGVPQIIQQLKCGLAPDDLSDLATAYSPLANYIASNDDIQYENIAAATVFTTQDVKSDMEALRTAVRNINPEDVDAWTKEGSYTDFTWYTGDIVIPIFQTGTAPYSSEGGEIVFESGVPQQTGTETVTFSLSVPTTTAPASGWPIVVYQHGTGGDYESYIYNGVASILGEKGIAVVGISQPLHWGRDGYDSASLELNVFNIINPIAFRDNIRQSAAEVLFLVHMINEEKFTVPAAVSGDSDISFDTDNIMFMGHSQGSTTGPPAVAVEPDIKGAVFSGPGGGLRDTILFKIKPELDFMGYTNIPEILAGLMGIADEDMNCHHPLINVVQLGGETADAINFARYFTWEADEDMAKDIMITCGVVDYYVPPILAHSLAIAAHANPASNSFYPFRFLDSWTEGAGPEDVENPYEIAGLDVLSPSVSNNLTNPDGITRTSFIIEYENRNSDGHFVAFNNDEAIDQYSQFLYSLAYEQDAELIETTAP